MLSFLNRFKYFDIPLLVATLLLAAAGLALLYATTLSDSSSGIFYRQLVFLILGLGAFFFFSVFNYHSLAKTNRILYPVLILMLIYLLVFGISVRASTRWLDFGFVRFH